MHIKSYIKSTQSMTVKKIENQSKHECQTLVCHKPLKENLSGGGVKRDLELNWFIKCSYKLRYLVR